MLQKESLTEPRSRWRVLIFPGGTEIALELRQALGWCKEVELFSAGAPISNHAPFVFAHHTEVSSVSECGWLDGLAAVIDAHDITHVFPAHDDTLVQLVRNASSIQAKIVTSPAATCLLTRSKTATLRHLTSFVPSPRVFLSEAEVVDYPVFVKPDQGQGSQRTAVVYNRQQLQMLLGLDPSLAIFEYVPGPEFTVDCFSDRETGLLYVGGRERIRVRSGIAMDSGPIQRPEFKDYAARISDHLDLHGGWFFQVKEDSNGILKLLEIAPRIAGTSAISRVRGVNLPLLSLYESDRIPVQIAEQHTEVRIDRALTNRYRHDVVFDELLVDFDDTLVVRGRLNVNLVKLLFQAFARGVRLVLVTRCGGNLERSLERWRLDALFDQIVHLTKGESKADCVQSRKAILIDDSFVERLDVRTRIGIPVFDSTMIEMLFDDRI